MYIPFYKTSQTPYYTKITEHRQSKTSSVSLQKVHWTINILSTGARSVSLRWSLRFDRTTSSRHGYSTQIKT